MLLPILKFQKIIVGLSINNDDYIIEVVQLQTITKL